MRFIHVADIHASKERLSQTLQVLRILTERAKKQDISFILFAGDFWDSTITATKGSGFTDILQAVRELEKHAFLYFVYGTPTHEPKGSLDVFVSDKTRVISEMCSVFDNDSGTEIIAIPEPRRSDYIGASIQETDLSINKSISDFINSLKSRDKNRVVVYHGEVKGVLYQNGVAASSATAIPKELLMSLSADYYALGHIHMPQEIFHNAWYAGSAAPKDFGEIHDGSYNLVEIENENVVVERVSFNLPVFQTVRTSYAEIENIKADFSGKNMRLQFQCAKEQRKALNIKQLQDKIKERTKAVSVRIEPEVVEAGNAAKSEVSKRKSAVEKLEAYAEEKQLKIPRHAKELLREIQDSSLIKYAYPQHSFELLSLSLRGAIGIRDGQQKDEFDIDFEQLDDGVVCLIGKTGHGKTTIVENCHPYPCMLTRSGTLKEHFFLKDSHRILVYKDENGVYYRISMLIDGKNVTGKAVYFAETSSDREKWTSIPETDGSLASYQEWVNQTFGTIDVFLRTAFFAKEQSKGIPDISATTKGERMELLSKLAGTDSLKEISLAAGKKRKEAENDTEKVQLEIESYTKYKDIIKQNELDIESFKNELKTQNLSVETLEKKLSGLKEKDIRYREQKALNDANKIILAQYTNRKSECENRLSVLKDCLSKKDVFETVLQAKKNVESSSLEIEKLQRNLSGTRKEYDLAQEEVSLLKSTISDFKLKISKLETSEKFLESQIEDVETTCPTCGQPLPFHKIEELKKHMVSVRNNLNEIAAQKENTEFSLSQTESMLKEKDNTVFLKEKISEIESALSSEIDKKEENASYLENLGKDYAELSYEDVLREADSLGSELKELEEKIGAVSSSAELEDVSEQLAETEASLKRENNRAADLNASIKSAEKENERYRLILSEADEKKKMLNELSKKTEALNFIEDAFSNSGIPAIELRESAPEIAGIANRILLESYGNKFEIRFGSTSELKTKRKTNEDFNILVYDIENGDEKTIDLVSSGERIWIKQALFYAFSIVQMNRTGFNFRIRLIDESDSSLDSTLRPKYLKMVTSAHVIADARLTVLITHSQEIKDVAQQVIEI